MEYYAKSPTKVLTDEKKRQIIEKTQLLLNEMRCDFQDKELEEVLKDYEKSLFGQCEAEHKTLTEHLDETVKCAEEFFDVYGDYFTEKEKKLILIACREHDIGKVNYIFQTKVNPALPKVREEQIPHGFLSALCMDKKEFLSMNPNFTNDDFDVLVTSVYFHHNRMDIYDKDRFLQYSEKYLLEHIREYKGNEEISFRRPNHNHLLFSNESKHNVLCIPENVWCEYMLVKGMLNKFDWSVSAGHLISEMKSDRLEKLLCKTIERKISGELRPAQTFMSENRDKNVVVIAPTGSGKTEAALLWLNGEKGFYTLPLKVSSNAIYKRIKENYEFENVALLHSDSMSMYVRETEHGFESGYKHYEQAKLLSYPLTVCTVDQLFKFVYKALGTEIFAATLKYSKIIIDEIQSYSPNIVAALLYGLSEIQHMGGKFAIITATFPPVLKHFMKKCHLIEDIDYVYEDFSNTAEVVRHKIKIVDGDFDVNALVEASYKKKVLVICNTVKMAQKLYNEIGDKCNNAGLLHSRFVRKHRDILENDIMAFSKDMSATGIWITTQIVEASLDIDFDILFTEMCTADSLLQRMGRCNRAGMKSTDDHNIIIFNNGSASKGKVDGIYDKDIFNRSIEYLRKYDGMLLSEADKISYINAVYNTEQIKNTSYYEEIEENIKKFNAINPLEYEKKTADGDFRNMDSVAVLPDKIYNENQALIESIAEILNTPGIHSGVRKILKTKLESITLNVNVRNRNFYPKGIDRGTIKVGMDIHRANLKYDFDEETGRGMGLLLDVLEDEFLIM